LITKAELNALLHMAAKDKAGSIPAAAKKIY